MSTQDLAAQLRKKREFEVAVGRHVFLARRQTHEEAVDDFRNERTNCEVAKRYVCGWKAGTVLVDDIMGDGTQDHAIFSRMTWEEWCADRPDFWKPISEALQAEYHRHALTIDGLVKN